MAPSIFIAQQYAALAERFGDPATNAPLAVSDVDENWGGRTAGDVRPNHALRAARQVRARETWQIGDPDGAAGAFYLAVGLSDITTTPRAHSLVSLTNIPGTGRPFVKAAWRLPSLETDLRPTEALLAVIEQFGTPVWFGGIAPALFIPLSEVESPERRPLVPQITLGDSEVRADFVQRAVRSDGSLWVVCWVYAIELRKYLAATEYR